MYDLIDRPIADLPVFERGVLDSMRRWVHALTLAGVAPENGDGDPFDAAMRALDGGSSEQMVIQRPCHSHVEEIEAVLLSLWRLVRENRLAMACGAAERLVDRDHARRMIAAMARACTTR